MKNKYLLYLLIILSAVFFSCDNEKFIKVETLNTFQKDLSKAARNRAQSNVTYDGRYFNIDYPNGDIPSNLGVCTDVIIRSYREVGIDLQELLHIDIKNNFNKYPIKKHWPTQRRADSNIDHRRVPNLEYFFSKHGLSLPVTNNKKDYKPGDIITWDLMGSSPWHIGIITDMISEKTGNPIIVHNIGKGPILDDVLFLFPIRGHYRYIPNN